MSGRKKVWRVLAKIVGALCSAALLVLAAASLILAKPQENAEAIPASSVQPLSPSPALEIQSEGDLYRLAGEFPAPIMSFLSGSGMTFVSALSADSAWGSGFARVATLWWQTADGIPVTLQSIFPGDALSFLEAGFHFSAADGPVLFGNASVRMENSQMIRIHVATGDALYVLFFPFSLEDRIPALCRSVQLFTVSRE